MTQRILAQLPHIADCLTCRPIDLTGYTFRALLEACEAQSAGITVYWQCFNDDELNTIIQ